jgi:gliding motility-associated-like protein
MSSSNLGQTQQEVFVYLHYTGRRLLIANGTIMRFFILSLFYLTLSVVTRAQECMPSPGAPIFLEDFGSGSNPGPAVPQGTTTYTYGSTNTGGYVVTNTTDLDPNFWHKGVDHTEGDINGYMLLFNVSEGPGIFYQKTITGLCPNTNYIFSYHVANVVIPIACIGDARKPNVRTTVINPADSTIQVSTRTKEIFFSSFLTWREYAIPFRTGPEQTSALVQLINAGISGCGGDLAIDDISLRLCNVQLEQSFDLCDLPDGSLTVGSNTYTEPGTYLDFFPVPNSCNDTVVTTTLTGTTRLLPTLRYTFCEGDVLEVDGRRFTSSASFVDTLAGATPDCPRFQPYEIKAQPLLSFEQEVTLCHGDSLRVGNNWYTRAGTYIDSLSTPSGCDSIVITSINTGEIAVEISPPMAEVEQGQSLQLMSSVSFSSSYTLSWQPQEVFSCSDCPDPVLQASSSGVFQLTATDLPSGCADSAVIEVSVLACDQVFVPNAFSPNGDGVNDRLSVFTNSCFTRLLSWRIFDRWGALIYEVREQSLDNELLGWDGQVNGQPAEQGVYIYQLIMERSNGMQKAVRGDVMLVR